MTSLNARQAADPAADVRYLLSYDRTVQVCVPNTPELFRMAWGHNHSTHSFEVPFVEMDAAPFIEANRAARKAEVDAINARAAERAEASRQAVAAKAALYLASAS